MFTKNQMFSGCLNNAGCFFLPEPYDSAAPTIAKNSASVSLGVSFAKS